MKASTPSGETEEHLLSRFQAEPAVSVGLMSKVAEVRFTLSGDFTTPQHKPFPPGEYRARSTRATQHEALHANQLHDPAPRVELQDSFGSVLETAAEVTLIPTNFDSCCFTLHRITIGKEFHWQREESQSFRGTLQIGLASSADPEESGLSDSTSGVGLTVINEIPLESYLVSVISSEMSASSPTELLKAHAIISRSWLMAQILRRLQKDKSVVSRQSLVVSDKTNGQQSTINDQRLTTNDVVELIRWTGRENHTDFDVCADDHCQRYQGITKAHSQSAFEAVARTHGFVLTYKDEVCDARFSKCCGGMTENYRSAWEDQDVAYLRGGAFDGDELPGELSLPLTEEANAAKWIIGRPPAYCNMTDQSLLERILPDFDLETRDFFRWESILSQDEVQALIKTRLGLDPGSILALEPLERGVSGRIVKLKIVGERASAIIGKELEIRRALSWTHLYSSAFIVRPEGGRRARERGSQGARELESKGGSEHGSMGAKEQGSDDLPSSSAPLPLCSSAPRLVPERFRIVGAGWGHGVGLCQIGAAVMAANGKSFQEILSHYYDQCVVKTVYD